MTNLFVASRYHVIKEYPDFEINEGMVEKLDEMLNQYNVKHFFSLPDGDETGAAKDQDDVLNCYYDDTEDDTTFFLVYALWSKTVRKMDDERIRKGMGRYIEKHIY